MYQKLTYGDDGRSYVRLKLSQYGTLWRLLAQEPIENGRVFAYLPPSASQPDLAFFEWHLHKREDLEERRIDREYLARERDFVAARLLEKTRPLGVFYGAKVPPGMKARAVDLDDVTTYYKLLTDVNSNQPDNLIGTEPYYIVNRGLSRLRLDFVLDNVVERLPFIGVLTSLPPDRELPKNKRLNKELLTDLARYAHTIIVGAYGGDANLIWTRNN